MLIDELITKPRLINHAINADGEIWREFPKNENKRTNRPSAKKQANGLTIRQTEIVDYIHKNQPCRSTDISNYIGIMSDGITTSAKPLIAKGLIDKDKKTTLWFNPKNRPTKIKKATNRQKVIDMLQSNKFIRRKQLSHISNASVILNTLKKEGLVHHKGYTWRWIWL